VAVWSLKYTIECIEKVKQDNFRAFEDITQNTQFSNEEVFQWKDIIENMYFPKNKESGIFLQQDGFMDKTLTKASEIPESQLPINQHWTWDRIVRSSLIKQADVIQGLYFFEENFDKETIRKNFNFYEPLTVHESSLSPCIHSIVASKIGDKQKAYDLYLRTARLDLDDYNNDTADGCHITSMGGTWMAFVKGFGGMRTNDGKLSFKPFLPEKWDSYSFRINFRGMVLEIKVNKLTVCIENLSDQALTLLLYDQEQYIGGNKKIEVQLKHGYNEN